MIKIIMFFFIIKLFTHLYVKVSILLTCRKRLHDNIISLKRKVWAHKASLTCHFLLKCQYQTRKVSGHGCMLGGNRIDFASLYYFDNLFDFGIVPTVWYILFFILFIYNWLIVQIDKFSRKVKTTVVTIIIFCLCNLCTGLEPW